jgi:hypothetical protein
VGGAVGAFALMFGGQSAMAESNNVVQRTDPGANSPAGVIYQIPLDSARREAAPVLPVGSRPGGGGGGTTGSSANIGAGSGSAGAASSASSGAGDSASSGRTSGDSASGAGSAVAQNASATSPDDGGTPTNPSSIHSENGFGSSSQVPGVSRAALLTGAGVPATRTPGSTLPTYLLMALVAMAAVAAGLFATGTRRRRPEGTEGRPAD